MYLTASAVVSLSKYYFHLFMFCHGFKIVYDVCEFVHVDVSCCFEFVAVKEEVHLCLDLTCRTVSTISSLGNHVFICLPVLMARLCLLSLYLVRVCLCFVSLTVRGYYSLPIHNLILEFDRIVIYSEF